MDAAGMDGWGAWSLAGGATVMTDHVLKVIAMAGWRDDDEIALAKASVVVEELENHGYAIEEVEAPYSFWDKHP